MKYIPEQAQNSCFMHELDGQKSYIWPYGNMHSGMLFTSITLYLPRMMAILDWKSCWNQLQYKMKENYTVGCPVLALHNDLQRGYTIPQWSPCTRLGVNHCPFSLHACNISLIVKISASLSSSQDYIRHDDFFETTNYPKHDMAIPPDGNNWWDYYDSMEKMHWRYIMRLTKEWCICAWSSKNYDTQCPRLHSSHSH